MIRYCKVCDEPMGAEPGMVHMECQEDDELDDELDDDVDEAYIVGVDDWDDDEECVDEEAYDKKYGSDDDDEDDDDGTDLWDGGGE